MAVNTADFMHRYMKDSVCTKAKYILSVLDECFHKYIVGQYTEAIILGGICTPCLVDMDTESWKSLYDLKVYEVERYMSNFTRCLSLRQIWIQKSCKICKHGACDIA